MGKPIFSNNYISHYLSDFRASSITNVRDVTLTLESLNKELESGKLESFKEEEIGDRFINSFFGTILGFDYSSINEWLLRLEKKSTVDGKKPDGVLGFFYNNKEKDDVRAVIEIKDANTELDKKQSRANKQTPVEQAFSYVSKMGGNCKWVIVSNLKEIRFYPANDESKYQVFFLKDLVNEDKRNELLFFFHKNHFIKKHGQSKTDILYENIKQLLPDNDTPIHIIDKMYKSIFGFKGLNFIDPEYIAQMYPFNILDDYVWHYHNRNLLTLNSEIYDLLNNITINDRKIVFSKELKIEIKKYKVEDAQFKLGYIFEFFNNCLINEISAIKDYKQVALRRSGGIGFSYKHHFDFKQGDEGITKQINFIDDGDCKCMVSGYRNLDFNKLLNRIKSDSNSNTLEFAYANYLISSNNYKVTYTIYKNIENNLRETRGREVEYFITKLNIKQLHNLIKSSYDYADSVEILKEIKSIDLNKVIYDDIEYRVDREVKEYLLKIKEDSFINKYRNSIEETVYEIEKLKELYDNGGKQYARPSLPSILYDTYLKLHNHVNGNSIIYNVFTEYKILLEKVFKGFVISYQTKDVGLISFNEFILTEVVINHNPTNLKKTLLNIDVIKTDENVIFKLVQKLKNFITSYFKEGIFGDPYQDSLINEQLINFDFKNQYLNIFSNIFILFSKLDIAKNQFIPIKKEIIQYLKIENELAWYNIENFGTFLQLKGNLFESKELFTILEISIDRTKRHNNKYHNLIESASKALQQFYPKEKYQNCLFIETAILKSKSEKGIIIQFEDLIHLYKISNNECKAIITSQINASFNHEFNVLKYETLLRNKVISYKTEKYFYQYCKSISKIQSGDFGKPRLTSLAFINFINLIYYLDIKLADKEIELFSQINNFETWLLTPSKFDYSLFDVKWLTEIKSLHLINKIELDKEIFDAIESELIRNYNSDLAEVKYKLLNKN